MGTSRSAGELAFRLGKAGDAIVNGNRKAVGAAADVYKDSVLREARKDTGGDLRLSRWGRNGLALRAGYDVDGNAEATARLTARPQGPWKVLEYGARPHVIVAGLTRRQGQALALFSFMAGGAGSFDLGELASTAAGNNNNRRSRRSRARARALRIGTDLRPYANHPGAPPKRTWSNGIAPATPGAIAATRRTHAENIAAVFR
jgi:hypothetical protein